MNKHGTIKRTLHGFCVEVKASEHVLQLEGVTCLNPEGSVEQRIYRKEFRKKRIYLPHEYVRAIEENMGRKDTFVFSMNGYSRITDKQCRRYGVLPLAYEEACKAVLRNAIQHLREKFSGANLYLIDGASDMGVDSSIHSVAHEFNLPTLGFSCPSYMLYVADDDRPVYVAENSDLYGDYYVKSLDLLITTGGREQALKHDVLAACMYGKRIHFVDVLNMLSDTGGVPATVVDESGKITVDNAAAAFGRNISFFSREGAVASKPSNGDLWDAVFQDINSVSTDVCRRKMSPQRKFV